MVVELNQRLSGQQRFRLKMVLARQGLLTKKDEHMAAGCATIDANKSKPSQGGAVDSQI